MKNIQEAIFRERLELQVCVRLFVVFDDTILIAVTNVFPGFWSSRNVVDNRRFALHNVFLVLKCFRSRDPTTLTAAFKTYVRPLLEYNSQVWSPHLVKDIDSIEKIQRRFTKRLLGMKHHSYEERLFLLNLERLEVRRIKSDVICAYKILFGHTAINNPNLLELYSSNYNTRGHKFKLIQHNCRCDTSKYFYTSRTAQVWNNLPADTTDFSSLSLFIKSLGYHTFDKLCIGKR